MAEELDVDRKKRPLYAIKKCMRTVAGQPTPKDRTRRSTHIGHGAGLFAKYKAREKVLRAGG